MKYPKMIIQLELALCLSLTTFKNIFKYNNLQSLSESVDISLHQMFGTITPYIVIHIQVALFDTNIMIQLDYEQYDYRDPISKSLIEYMDISSVC
jgi:hypothetical protein